MASFACDSIYPG